MQNEEKQNPFANFTLSDDAVHLANAIYNTYVLEDDPELVISVDRLYAAFRYARAKESYDYINHLFTQLNEPIAVSDFEYRGTIYGWKILEFCKFTKPWQEADDYLELEINEMYLAAMGRFMDEPFLKLFRKDD